MRFVMNETIDPAAPQVSASALRTVAILRDGLDQLEEALKGPLGDAIIESVKVLAGIQGRVIVTGVGKSGHIGSKIAATLASTGTPAFFVHPAEANHGDLGMIARDDVLLAMSWSGETSELKGIVAYSKRFSIPLIAMTSGADSALGRAADITLRLPRATEACPHGLAPTTSTMMQLALGDALAVALLEARGFTARDFKTFHPGGQLGANLSTLSDVMHTGDRVPILARGATMRDAVIEISQKGFGCVGVVGPQGNLRGIITDGDLRRHIAGDILGMAVDDVMTHDPLAGTPDMLVASALNLLNRRKISALMVVEEGKPVGIVHLHDLLRVGAA